MLDLAKLKSGMHVLDLATGRGEPAVRAAHRVGPSGTVLGVDLAEPMLQMARERADREGLTNLELKAMNVESLAGVPKGFFQVTLVRWGLMYLDAPIRALSAARQAMSPTGVLVAATWAEPERVSYYTLPRTALAKFVSVPPIDQDAPGEFYYADPGRLATDFATAGFEIQEIEDIEVEVMEAKTSAELIAWTRAIVISRLLKDVPKENQKNWEEELVRLAEPLRKDGYIRLGGVTRIVVATIDNKKNK